MSRVQRWVNPPEALPFKAQQLGDGPPPLSSLQRRAVGQGGHPAPWHQPLLPPPFHLAPGHVPHCPLKGSVEGCLGPLSTKEWATEEPPQVPPPSWRGGWLPTMQGRGLGQSAYKQHSPDGSQSSRSLPTDGGPGHDPSRGLGEQALADTPWDREVSGRKVATHHSSSRCGSGTSHRPESTDFFFSSTGTSRGTSGDRQLRGALFCSW
ncbi:unnamed protein product [Nyctereutes procyonoides]|uniref:(raccoon dog) hypothetical protein n=1 Tax=Nyctereutes procyonoides TaxID=34880 RepID=A0A811Y3M2_NYCPR|nr:unnamed protein product [Nyctereutes procyonoides]